MAERKPRLEGKVAIVTGAGSRGPGVGNGKATAVTFAREGARVLLVDMHPDRMDETLNMIKAEGGEASIFAADVTRPEDCKALVAAAVERYGKLDILHNNVGIDSTGTVVDIDIDEWDRVMSINLRSMVIPIVDHIALCHLVVSLQGLLFLLPLHSVLGILPQHLLKKHHQKTQSFLQALVVTAVS